jgi:hypothetical protein
MQEEIWAVVARELMWRNVRQPVTNNPRPHIIAGLPLVFMQNSFSHNSQIISGHVFICTFCHV